MKRRGLKLFFISLILLLAIWFFWPKHVYQSGDCPFCKETVLERQKLYEDDLCYVLYTHRPIVEGHCLIIPKRHIERFEELSNQEALRICELVCKCDEVVSKKLGTSSYLLLQKNGVEVGQTVPHVHVHYLPRQEGDSSTIKFLVKMFWANASCPISDKEMGQKTELLKISR